MLKHIVMWKLKEDAAGADKAANAAKMKRMLEGCANLVPGTVEFEVAVAAPGLEATCECIDYEV